MADVTITGLNDLTPSANTYVPISNGTTTGKAIYSGSGNPTGTVIIWVTSTPPAGYIECNGAAISRSTYSALFNVIQTTYGSGDGSTTFNLPDLRGEFIRGWDNGRGIDSGRSLGSSQLDQFQGHYHAKSTAGLQGGTAVLGANSGGNIYAGSNAEVRQPTTDGTNGAPRTGSETRPRNIALMYCIKT